MLGAPGSNGGSVSSRVARSSTKEGERWLAQVRDRPARRRLFRCLCIPGAARAARGVGKFWADAVDNVKALAGSRFKETDRSND